MDFVTLRKFDLRRRGYGIHEIRNVASQWAHALSRQDANKWLHERELEMTVARRVAS
jgi:hypothetical protein